MAADNGAGAVVEDDENLDALWGDEPPRVQAAPEPAVQYSSSSEEDSYFQGSGNESEDSATRRARQAAARVKDFGEEEAASARRQAGGGAAAGPAAAQGAPLPLPSAAAAFTSVEGPPAFLDPEATRPLAMMVHRVVNNTGPEGGPPPDPQSGNRVLNKRGQAAGEWDVSKMAPKLRDEMGEQEPGVITGQAVRYRTDDRVGSVSGAQIALLGGQYGGDSGGEDGEAGGGAPGAALPGSSKHPVPKGKASKTMGVNDFMDKGVGGALLPRKRQDRKDKEKDKRAKGQSTHAEWKTEAEMALRQQYD